MAKVTVKSKAWITPYSSISPADLKAGKRIDDLVFNKHSVSDWTYAGEAEITVELLSEKELVENKITALRAEAANIRAEATAETTRIESQIQTLLAISYDAPAEVATLSPEEPETF